MSRVTLHRIERGERSVTMGACHIDQASMEPAEHALLQALLDRLGGGRLLA